MQYDREAHRKYIGGGDASAVLGLSRWQTPLQLWAEKTGEYTPPDVEALYLTLGNRLEEVVAELFTEKTGKKVRRVNKTLYHPSHQFLGANIDREVVGDDAILECKTATSWKAKEWEGEEIPREYIIQVMHYLAVTGARFGYLAVLIGNQDFQVKMIERDEVMIKSMVEKEVAFWNDFVLPRVMPGISFITAKDSETLYHLFPEAKPATIKELTDDANKIIESRNAMIQDIKSLESQVDRMENELKLMIGDDEVGETNLWKVSWKNQKQERIDTKRLKEERPEVAAAFVKLSEFRKIDIRRKK